MKTLVMVTAGLGIGDDRLARKRGFKNAEAFAKFVESEWNALTKTSDLTIYVLGSMFDAMVEEDVADRYLSRLNGRKILITDPDDGDGPVYEADLQGWHEVQPEVELSLWGRKFLLSNPITMLPSGEREAVGPILNIHGQAPDAEYVDTGEYVSAHWDEWHEGGEDFAAQNLYALAVYAEHLGNGTASPIK